MDGFGALLDRIAPRFARYEPLRRGSLMLGLLSGLDRKNCWTIAEHRGDATPDGLQHLLSRAKWDADAVRDDLRGCVSEHFADPAGILVVDETGDLKKGVHTVGTQRQYTGTAGRIENAQVAVYLTYAVPPGHALINRALYLPKSWTNDPGRLERAGVPADVAFATKPALAQQMILSALDAGVPAQFVAGDEVYGGDSKLRTALEQRAFGFVLAVACDHRVPTAGGPVRADQPAGSPPARSWQKLSAGAGTKGPRFYSWAYVAIDVNQPGHQWLLLRRNDSTGEMAYFRCYSPQPAPLAVLVRVAGQRWQIEESFQAAKGQAGLDEHQGPTLVFLAPLEHPGDAGDGVPASNPEISETVIEEPPHRGICVKTCAARIRRDCPLDGQGDLAQLRDSRKCRSVLCAGSSWAPATIPLMIARY